MNISPINYQQKAISNNYTHKNQNTNFKGEFVTNEVMDKLVEFASINDRLRFREILKKMKTCNDGLEIWLEKYYNSGSKNAMYELYQQKIGDNGPKLKFDSFCDKSIKKENLLSAITESLEYLYINELHTKNEKPLIEEIKSLMVDNPTKPNGKY